MSEQSADRAGPAAADPKAISMPQTRHRIRRPRRTSAFIALTALATPLARRRARALAAAQPSGDPAECAIPASRESDGKVSV